MTWKCVSSAALVSLLVFAAGPASSVAGGKQEAQTRPAREAPSSSEMEAMMERWMELATPGLEHEFLAETVGRWKTTSTVWMDPAAPPEVSEGHCEIRPVLGGRFMMQECTGKIMGMPFEGIGLEGYDKFRKQYVSVWMDNLSTTTGKMVGSCDEEAGTCLYHGHADDYMTGEVAKPVKATGQRISPDEMVFEMFDLQGGSTWVRVLRIVYRRADSAGAASQ